MVSGWSGPGQRGRGRSPLAGSPRPAPTRRNVMSNVLYRWGRAAARHPWRMIGAWVLVAIAVFALNSSVGGDTTDDFSIPGTEAQQGVDLLEERFPIQGGVGGQVVFADPDGDVTDPRIASRHRRHSRRAGHRSERARRHRSVRSGERVGQRRRAGRLRDRALQRRSPGQGRGRGRPRGRRDRPRRRLAGRAVAEHRQRRRRGREHRDDRSRRCDHRPPRRLRFGDRRRDPDRQRPARES